MSGEDEEEGTAVDVKVDLASVIASSAGAPSSPEDEDDGEEPATSRLSLRAPVAAFLGGLTAPPAEAAVATKTSGAVSTGTSRTSTPSGDAPRPSRDVQTDDSSVSLVTPRFDSGALAKQLAHADAAASAGAEAAEDDTSEIGTAKREPVQDLDDSTTLERAVRPDADDEQTLDAPAAVSVPTSASASGEGEEETTSRRDSPYAGLGSEEKSDESSNEATPGYPAMRPRYDSEAAGQWPPWHAQPEEARAQLRGVISPVSSGTEILPRNTVDEALRILTEAPPPVGAPPPSPLAVSPQALPPPAGPALRDPLAHRLETPQPEPAVLKPNAHAASGPPRGPGSTPSTPVTRELSPFAVFVLAFLFTGGVFGGLVASNGLPQLGRGSAATAVSPATEATEPISTNTTASASESAGGSASAAPSADAPAASASPSTSASAAGSVSAAPSASASAAASAASAAPRVSASAAATSASPKVARPKTRSGPRPRGKTR